MEPPWSPAYGCFLLLAQKLGVEIETTSAVINPLHPVTTLVPYHPFCVVNGIDVQKKLCKKGKEEQRGGGARL